jgi:uncharacterized glyoxalase superfamily protein PhnB
VIDPERPFRSLARPTTPVDPEPAFASALRDRLRRAVLGQAEPPPSPAPVPATGGPAVSALIPYLIVRDARGALAWYADAFGASTVGETYVMDDDRIGHAELEVVGATLYLADEYPEMGLTGPEEGRVNVSLHLTVPDADRTVARAESMGATVERPVTDASYGRTGAVIDPYGHRWTIQTRAHATAAGPKPGDTAYLTLRVPDGARARDFYGAVLGWSAVPGRVPDGWQVEGTSPMTGIGGGATEPSVVPMYAVDDIEVAVAAVRSAGGKAGEIDRQPYGLTSECRDDQGLPFYLGQLS